jgi:hypothetical protein
MTFAISSIWTLAMRVPKKREKFCRHWKSWVGIGSVMAEMSVAQCVAMSYLRVVWFWKVLREWFHIANGAFSFIDVLIMHSVR